MKLLSFTLAVIILPFLGTFAQLDEAHIVYDIKMESSEPEVEAQLAMLEGSKLEIMFKGHQARQMFSMGSMMTTTTITDSETGEALMLIDGMMGKFASRTTPDDIEEPEEDVEVELIDETKTVAGYECKKAVLIDDDGNESTFWYTDEILKPQTDGKYFKGSIPGMPLEFTVVTPQITMTMTATELSEKVKKSKKQFDMEIPEGYQEKSIDELQNAMGG